MSVAGYDALLVISFGGPEGRDQVLPFLENVVRGRHVPRARLLEVAEHYYHFEGVSPINAQNQALMAALDQELREYGIQLPIYLGNRNWHPLLPDVVGRMAEDGVQRALALVASAFGSYSGCRQYQDNLSEAQRQVGVVAPQLDKIRTFYNHPGFIEAVADRVHDALRTYIPDRSGTLELVYTAHSIPVAMAERGPYQQQLEEACRLVSQLVGQTRWSLVYQSRSGPPHQPWLEPDVSDHLRHLGRASTPPDVVLVPIGFLSDHLEVLYDLDVEARGVSDSLGLQMVRAGTVGVHPRFVAGLRQLIEERLYPAAPRLALGQYGPSADVCSVDCCGGSDEWRSPASAVPDTLPSLYRDVSFWGMTATQFLGAFNDNLFKQLMLLLAIPPAAAAAGAAMDMQGLATIVFSLPFVLGSGFAGFLSDRYSKRRVIVASKVAEIGVMLLGLFGFLAFGWFGYAGLLMVLFLMGVQSTFFGPGKYGILPELFRRSDLPQANGVILMTTFLAIILGMASAGTLMDVVGAGEELPRVQAAQRLWVASLVCVGIAVAGTATSLIVRPVPPAKPELQLDDWTALFVPAETRSLLRRDLPLLMALLATCVFWMVSGIAVQAVNALGRLQLGLDWTRTSIMTASIGVGICTGALVAGKLSRGRVDFRLVRVGSWAIIAFLVALSIWLPNGQHFLGYPGSIPVLILLGAAAAVFAIPLQVFIQAQPPQDQKGRMIATMNVLNFTAILLSGVIYSLFYLICLATGWPPSAVFAMMAVLMLPVALGYRPKNEPAE